MTFYSIDVSSSMHREQIISACKLVQEKYIDGDTIVVFDNAAAKVIKEYEIELVLKHKTISELQRSLYGRRKRIVGFGRAGSKIALDFAGNNKETVCLTNDQITDDEAEKYQTVIKL